MKIAIVAPSPVPFTIGGVENLLWGMNTWINQNTEHQVELIKLPSREMDFWSLIKTYHDFYKLDLDYFDMVISTKYPAWMVRHKNHVVYLQHRLRGLYDTYHFTKLTKTTRKGYKKVDRILDYMKDNADIDSLDVFFNMLFNLQTNCEDIPQDYFSFPGPFIREIINFLDNNALSKKNIRKFLCISNTVKKRLEYFPKNCDVTAIHHPSNLKEHSHGEFNYVFMVSRLDGPKRINLLIEAMRYVKSDIKLYIAGTGPQENELKSLANGDQRIEFLGFVNDEIVEDYYKNSLVVPYFPYDEDYGLITIEAMMHGKPVITTVDSGGPTEFVINNQTGFVVNINPKEIAEKIDYLSQNKIEAKRMGLNAYNNVKEITWDKVVSEILGKNINNNVIKSDRKKVLITSTFPIYPPQGGGQVRTYELYKNLAKDFDIEVISITNELNGRYKGLISKNFCENQIPKTQKHSHEEWETEKKLGVPVTDVVMPQCIKYTPEYLKELKKSINEASIVILSHPYFINTVQEFIGSKPFIYDAQDVEYTIKKGILPPCKTTDVLLNSIFELEKECCEKSKFIMTCSEEDRVELIRLYNVPIEKIIVVPNGVDTSATVFHSVEERINNKRKSGLENEKIGLFMGSWHGPNLEACEQIFKIAEKCKDTKFLLMGSQCEFFKNKKIPFNVGLLGLVDENTKNRVFSLVDFALNPMLSGSGTNLKMFDYMSAGIPVITTEFGTRGIDNKDIFIVSEISDMAEKIAGYNIEDNKNIVLEARKYTEEEFDWQVISKGLSNKISF